MEKEEKTIEIKMKKTAAGPAGTFINGKKYKVDEKTALQFVRGEAAEIVDEEAAAAATLEEETEAQEKKKSGKKGRPEKGATDTPDKE